MSFARQLVRRAIVGFVAGFFEGFAVWSALLCMDLANPHFEAMYEAPRPYGVLGILRFQGLGDVMLYAVTGLIGALMGLATTRSPLILRLLAIPFLALLGSVFLAAAWLNLSNVDRQPYSLLVTIALAGLGCLIAAAWIAFEARPSRVRSIDS